MAHPHQSTEQPGPQDMADAMSRWGPTSWEARLLTGSLRGVAVTLLHGSDAASRDALLRRGILPLLGRRVEDHPEHGSVAQVLPFPERRGARLARKAASSELVVLIDEWDQGEFQPPLAERLQTARRAAHPQERSCRVLLVLQGFEIPLAAAAQSIFPDPFWRELAELVGDTPTGGHLLMLTDDAASPGLRWLARQIQGLGDHALRLDTSATVTMPPQLTVVPDIAAPVPRPALGENPAAPANQDWLQSIDAALQRVASSARDSQIKVGEPVTVQAVKMTTVPDAAEPTPAHRPLPLPLPLPRPRPQLRRLPWLSALGAATCIGLVVLIGRLPPAAERQPVADNAVAPAPVARLRPAPAPAPTMSAAAQPPAEPGQALLQALAGLQAVDLREGQRQVSKLLASDGKPQLALVRYDALQALPETRAFEGLRLVAPLFVEPVQTWVRADSKLRSLQDLGRARIDVGRDGGDALSAAGLSTALFGAPRSPQSQLADAQALAALQSGKVDALMRTRASPLTAQANAAVAAGSLRRLVLDRADPAHTAVLHEYLPLAVQGQPGIGVMNFLVVRGGDTASGERLAEDALRSLCAALPALRAADAARWNRVQPALALPAGRPYVATAENTRAACGTPIATTSPTQGRRTGALPPT